MGDHSRWVFMGLSVAAIMVLVSMLRSTRKEKKVLQNVWAGLKQLNLAPGGSS